jgi:hypothetical protein
MKKLALFLRYQTTYERAFYRALNSLKKLQRERCKTIRDFVSQKRTTAPTSCVGARHAAPDFVSQNRVGAMHASPFQAATTAFKPAQPFWTPCSPSPSGEVCPAAQKTNFAPS